MARLPGISARATPRKKSSSASSPKATSSSAATPKVTGSEQVSKAAKRAAKRAQLLQGDEDGLPPKRSSSASAGPSIGLTPTISKSALRRRKRKIRDQAVLGEQGMDQIKGQLEDIFDEGDDDGEADAWDEANVDAQLQGVPDGSAPMMSAAQRKAQANQAAGKAKVGSKMRQRVLAQESLRQPHILKDLLASQQQQQGAAAGSNPFALIRQHAQNSLGLAGPVHNSKVDGDVSMR